MWVHKKIFIFHQDIKCFVWGYHCNPFFALILQVKKRCCADAPVSLLSCIWLNNHVTCLKSSTGDKQTTTISLILTCNLLLLLSANTSSPSWILAILPTRSHHPLVYTSAQSLGFAGNIALTCRNPLVDALPSFLRQMFAMPSISSPLGRLKMPPRSLRSSRISPTSLSPLRQLVTI